MSENSTMKNLLSHTGEIFYPRVQMPHKTRKIGTRAQVMHGTAEKTKGGLTKKSLKYNKYGRIVSKRKSAKGVKGF
jgi:hypothetical protein